MHTRGRMGHAGRLWRPPVGADHDATFEISIDRRTTPARVLAVPCSVQRGAVAWRRIGAQRTDNTMQF